jgi:hypothetical protein
MKTLSICFIVSLLLTLSACGSKSVENKEVKDEGVAAISENVYEIRNGWSAASVTGKVIIIEKDTRQITLIGSDGNMLTVTASDIVERFDEIVVGDVITFDHVTYLVAEFRNPTPEEIATPLVVVTDAEKAPEGIAPAGAIGTVVKGIVSIEALNRPLMIATVKGPRGNFLTIPMNDAKFMEELRIGQVFILTYAEATAVSLAKE